MEEIKKIGLSYGCLADDLSKQLTKQGFKFNKEKVAQFQKQVDAINVLRFGLLTDSMVDKLLPKLHKQVCSHVAKQNQMKVTTP